MTPLSIVVWFNRAFRNIGLQGCSSHSGRRTFITRAARLVHKAGGSLRDVQLLAGHRSIQTTQRYIDGDTDAQRKLVSHDLMAMTVQDPRTAPTRPSRRGQRSWPSSMRSHPQVRSITPFGWSISVCCLAGSASLIDDLRAELRAEGVPAAIRRHDTRDVVRLADRGAQLPRHLRSRRLRATWSGTAGRRGPTSRPSSVTAPPARSCKATGIFMVAGTTRSAGPAPSPTISTAAQLPSHDLRNGRLNQTAYSLLPVHSRHCRWRPGRLDRPATPRSRRPADADRPARLREALIGPLREVYGVSDKVLTMTLSCILLAAPRGYEHLARGRRHHDRHRHPGAQLSAPHRDPGPVRRRPCLWRRPATGQAAAPTSLPAWPSRSTPGRSIRPSRPFSRGSCSTPSGGTAPSTASTSATAIASMIGKSCDNVYCQICSICDRICSEIT